MLANASGGRRSLAAGGGAGAAGAGSGAAPHEAPASARTIAPSAKAGAAFAVMTGGALGISDIILWKSLHLRYSPWIVASMTSVGVSTWIRLALGVVGLGVLVAIVRHIGVSVIAETLRDALVWLPLIGALEVLRVASETASSWSALGSLAGRIPMTTLFRAHLLGHGLGNLAPAPRVVNETIKATLVAPFVGVPAATSVGLINQAATLLAVGLFSLPCGAAIFVLTGPSVWFWTSMVHAVVLVGTGVALQAVVRARGPGRWLSRRLPRLAERAALFREHALETSLLAPGPTAGLLGSRAVQTLQYGIAAYAVGIDAGVLRAMAAEGVQLIASAVGVLVPAGVGAQDGAFSLASEMLGTTVARATSLALLMRCNQLLWLLIASAVALATRGRRRRSSGPP